MLSRSNAALVVIDIQDSLLSRAKMPTEGVIENTSKLITCARELGMPVFATEQYPEKLGASTSAIVDALGAAPRFAKLEFGCTNNDVFMKALEASGRRQVLLTGMETHVCVLQTALGAVDLGYEVFVARDAVASLEACEYEAGLNRMARCGVEVVTTRMAIFELLRAAGTPEFRRLLPLLK